MSINYVKGNLLSAPVRIIGHGCNARGVMGSGIAQAIKEKYPAAYEVYRSQFERQGLDLGQVVPWVGEKRIVLNCITQENFGRAPGVAYVDYGAVRTCMQRIEKSAQRHQAAKAGPFHDYPEIGLPKIGAGRGGGDWDRIAAIIEAEISSVQVHVYAF